MNRIELTANGKNRTPDKIGFCKLLKFCSLLMAGSSHNGFPLPTTVCFVCLTYEVVKAVVVSILSRLCFWSLVIIIVFCCDSNVGE